MTALFLKIIDMSISASWIILAVLALRPALKRAPKWVKGLLWCVVAARLLCPLSIESPFSLVPQSVGSGEIVSRWTDRYVGAVSVIHEDSAGYDAAVAAGREPIPAEGGGYYVVTAYDRLEEPSTVENTIMPALAIVWAAGILLLLSYAAVSCLRLRRRVDTAVLYRDNIFRSENVSAPFVLGVIRPRIYLPFRMDGQDLEHVIAHEQAHILRKDHWWKPLGSLLLAIHWFNPLMWLAYVLLCRDIELACDEKVIKGLSNEQRADYSRVLLACSANRRMIAACPLAFGEVGVKERVKSVMNYKKPAFWAVVGSVVVCAIVAVCFLTKPKQDRFDIKIVVPAGSRETFVFSDEEISPTKGRIIISAGANLGDTEVVLKTVEVREENAYDEPAYLTPGMPVEMYAEKGAWFKIGVNVQNPTDKDIVVYVSVENIQVRIGSGASAAGDGEDSVRTSMESGSSAAGDGEDSVRTSMESGSSAMEDGEDSTGGQATKEPAGSTLEEAISKAILEYGADGMKTGMIHGESHFIAHVQENGHKITVYLQVCTSGYYGYDGSLYQETGSNIPTAITFSVEESGEYTLEEYWIPRDGSYYASDLQDKFPQEALDAINAGHEEIQRLSQECYEKVMEEFGRIGGLESRISDLINTIVSSPLSSSSPQDYMEAHDMEYQELLGYGGYSLRYCFSEFLKGNQTGLQGKIMEEVCKGIISGWGLELEEAAYGTGQDWFDAFRGRVESLPEQYDDEEIEKNDPASWILLQML